MAGDMTQVPLRRRARGVPTSKDVALAAGVSQSTVSYVLSGKRPISEATRQQVLAAIESLTYEPHAGARALAGRRTNVIGLVVPFHSSSTAHGLMAFAEEIAVAARAHDHDVLMLTADEGPAGLLRVSRRAICDAVIAMEVATDDPRADVARDLAMPVIFIGLPGEREGLRCIDFDFEEAARLLVGELADAGAREIRVMGWGDDIAERINFVPRFRLSAVAEADRRGVVLRWTPVPRGRAGAEVFVAAEVAHAGDGVAVLAAHSGVELAGELQRLGLVPGRDLDLVALCTDADAELQHVPPTAVSPQPRDVSRRAIEWLFETIDDGAPPGTRIVDAHLTRRASVRGRTA
jgi:DNA-binding LacI/PurR family transcriptional regulator